MRNLTDISHLPNQDKKALEKCLKLLDMGISFDQAVRDSIGNLYSKDNKYYNRLINILKDIGIVRK